MVKTSWSTGSLFGRPRADVERALPEREEVNCPICDISPRTFGVDYQGFRLARCPSCELEFQSPRPTLKQLATTVYGAVYHRPEQRVADSIQEGHYTRQIQWFTQVLREDRRRVLDIGCGTGAFIRFAMQRGWSVDGTDIVISDSASQTGVDLWEGQLPLIEFGANRYDVVRFNHVLEHTQDPAAELRSARAVLTEGGLLYISVPNLAGLSVRLKSWQSRLHLKRRRWKHYSALHHLWFFTPQSLRQLVKEAGFELVHWETPVVSRPGQLGWVTTASRILLEYPRLGGILDLYARVS